MSFTSNGMPLREEEEKKESNPGREKDGFITGFNQESEGDPRSRERMGRQLLSVRGKGEKEGRGG